MITILMLGGAKRVSVARHIVDAFRRAGEQARVLSYELDWRVPAVAVAEIIPGRRWNDQELIPDLLRIIREREVSLLLPFVDSAVEICARLKPLCTDTFIPVSSEDVCRTMFDKVLAWRLFEEKGLPQPSLAFDTFPRIYKPRLGSASKGIFIARSEREVPSDINAADYLVQEYVEGAREFTVDCYVRSDGKPLSVVPRERLETAGGEAMRSVVVADSELIALSRKVLSTIELRGPVTLQFLLSPQGRWLLMEINPRLGGGVVTGIGAGSHLTDMLAAETLGRVPEPFDGWVPGTLMTRYTQEIIFAPCK